MLHTILAATAEPGGAGLETSEISPQQAIGLLIAAAVVVAWLVYIVVAVKRRRGDDEPALGSEIELAPNRKPYYDDDTLETRRLERWLGWSLVLLMITAIGPLVYWLQEPSRQEGAVEQFAENSVERGYQLFQPTDSPEHGAHFGCAECHGSVGQGGVARYVITDYLGRSREVTWAAPSLNDVMLRYDAEEVRTILVYGRANSPMPAWGVLGGGPMNDQQIDDLINYMASLTLTEEEVREQYETVLASAPGASEGERLFNVHCARCHTKGYSFGEPEVSGGGAFGPSLRDGVTLRQFPTADSQIEFITVGSEFGQPYGVRGVGTGRMPGFGARAGEDGPIPGILTEAQIRAIVEYERSL